MAEFRSLGQILDAVTVAALTGGFREMVIAAGMDPASDFIGRDLEEIDVRGEDLRGFNFTNANLKGGDFRRANVRGVCFDGAYIFAAIGLPDEVRHLVPYCRLVVAIAKSDRCNIEAIMTKVIGSDQQQVAATTDRILETKSVPIEYYFHDYLWTLPKKQEIANDTA